ncbi:DUF6907 domain-containing protein [Streptomyces xiamenensis]|uniref:DUF6907 domain-containing protein n=1 Tax=Streptomyces xiamenensis TaxID=408015 RepID=UPI0036EF7881
MTDPSTPLPQCPPWCAVDHEPELPHAAVDGYFHASALYRVRLPLHPELADDVQRSLTLDVAAMQRPGRAPEPPRIEFSLQGDERSDDSFSVIASPDQLDQAAAALERWRDLLEPGN